MRNLFYWGIIILLCSCEKHASLEEINFESPALETNKEVLAQSIAQAIASSLGNESFTSFLQNEALKMKDGDNDILFLEAINMDIVDESNTRGFVGETSFKNILKRGFEENPMTRANSLSFEQTLKSIEANYPLLQISIPDTEAGTLSQIDFINESPLVAYLPNNYDDTKSTSITSYDEYGNIHLLNSEVEPEVPVVVIGENERLIAVPLELLSLTRVVNYNQELLYYQDNTHAYYLKVYDDGIYGSSSGNTSGSGTSGGTSSTSSDVSRDSNNLMDYISKAKFRSQSAMRKYEAWTNGRPEMRVEILFMGQKLPNKTIRYSNKGWWEGATKTLNSQIINWNENTLGNYITYYWVEEDGGWDKEVEVSFTSTLPNGQSVTTKTKVEIESWDDVVGTSYVCYDDLIPSGGKEYDPTGSGRFSFWVNLQ